MPRNLRCTLCKRESSVSVSLAKFPQDIDSRQRWAEFCRISLDSVKVKSCLCSLHFTRNCYKSPVTDRRRITLKKGAIPTLLRDEPPVQHTRRQRGQSKSEVTGPETSRSSSQEVENIVVDSRRSKKNKRESKGRGRRFCLICGDVYSPTVSSFRFPTNPENRDVWLESLGIQGFETKEWHRVCSRHFPDGTRNSVPVPSLISTFDCEMKKNHRRSVQDVSSEAEDAVFTVRSKQEPFRTPVIPSPRQRNLELREKRITEELRKDDMGRRYCCVDSCPNRKCASSLLNIFLPPKDRDHFAKWEEMVQPHRRLPFTRTTGVCELHFPPGDVLREFVTKLSDGTVHKLARGRVSLAPGVYPTIFGRDLMKKRKSSCIEVKAPSTSEKEVTYIFDIGDDEADEESPISTEKKCKITAEKEEMVNKCKRETTIEDYQEKMVLDQEHGKDGVKCSETSDIIYDERGGRNNNDGDEGERDDFRCSKTLEDDTCELEFPDGALVELDCSREAGKQVAPSKIPSTDLREILSNEDPDKSIINDVEVFSRLCRGFIVSKCSKTGRRSNLDKYGTPLGKKDNQTEQDVFIYPTTKDLDVMTLVYNIDRVKYPSDSWFCTIKDGSPAFLCWGDGYKIIKKVIFNSQNLDPTIMIGDSEVKLSEVIRPRSIKEIGSILKLADSVELCTRYSEIIRPYTNCKGYFFRTQADDPNLTKCILCRFQKIQSVETKPGDNRVTFEEVCQAAESLVEDRELWSSTIIGSAVVFLGWWKQYRIEKLFIVTRDISTKIFMGDQFVTIEEIEYVKTLSDISAALDFLGKCRKCQGIKEVEKIDTRRAEDCRGFVSDGNMNSRISRCRMCVGIRNRVRLRNQRQRMKGQFVRCSKDQYPPLKLKASSLDKTSFEEELAVEDDELNDEGWLVDVLENVTFPSISWSYVVVDNSIIFQNWDDSFVVSKKVVINPDLNVQIYVMDNHVEIEALQSVENVDDVVRLLNIVDCIQICDGVDPISKDEGCTGYYYDPDAKSVDPIAAKRCPKCAKAYLTYARREQRWMKKIGRDIGSLTPSGEIMLNTKQSSAVIVEVDEDSPSDPVPQRGSRDLLSTLLTGEDVR